MSAERYFGALAEAPFRFDFLQTLRKVECLFPDKPRWGTALRPADEPLRLGQEPSMSFAPASLSGFHWDASGNAPRIEVRFFGLLGPNGPLPLHLTEHARNRLLHSGDASFARFLDVLQHRFLAFFYRAWAQANPVVSLDRPAEDRYGLQLGALMGMGMRSLRDRQRLPDAALLHHAGLFVRQVRNAEGLGKLVSSFFSVPARIEQFVGHWMTLDERDRTRLGRAGNQLARTAVSGPRIWDRQHKFRIVLGPLSLADYESFLPGGSALGALADCVHSYVGREFDWDLRLILARNQRKAGQLGSAQRLGWTSWNGCASATRDADELILDAERALRMSARVRPPHN